MSLENSQNVLQKSEKSPIITMLLAAILGLLGIHRFYLGRAGSGVLMLLCSLFVITSPISSVWLIVDMIRILLCNLTDSENRKLVPGNMVTFVIFVIIGVIICIVPIYFMVTFAFTLIGMMF